MKCEECGINDAITECDICAECGPSEAQTDGATCDNCDQQTTISLAPYGNSFMAVISCPNCGESYDTNLDEQEIKELSR